MIQGLSHYIRIAVDLERLFALTGSYQVNQLYKFLCIACVAIDKWCLNVLDAVYEDMGSKEYSNEKFI